jgi:hypothetical protein
MKITVFPNLATIITGHGKLKSYYHRFKIVNSPLYSCGDEETVNHVLFKWDEHRKERDKLKDTILKRGQSWPICQYNLITKHRKAFIKFVNTIVRMIGKKLNELEVANNVVTKHVVLLVCNGTCRVI